MNNIHVLLFHILIVVGDWYFAVLGRDLAPLILTVQINMDDVCFSKCSSHGLCTPPMDG